MSDLIVVHVADKPGLAAGDESRRVVQPCSRCGVVLLDVNLDRPPMVAGPDRELAWWPAGTSIAETWLDGRRSNPCMSWLPTDEEILGEDVTLCSRELLPEGTEVYTVLTDTP